MRKSIRITIFAGILIIFLCGVSSVLAAGKSEKAPSFSLCQARPAMQTTVLRGYTRARWQRKLVCEESGRCLEVIGEMGDVVSGDGLFARIDTIFIDLALKANRAACVRFENQISYWQHEVERYRSLSGQKAVSEKKVLDLEQKYDQAKLALAELQIKARVLEERRRRCRINAPKSWHILKRMAEPGEWLTTGHPVAVVADYETLLVPFSLTLAQYEWVKKENENHRLHLTVGSGMEPAAAVDIPVRLLHVSPAFELASRKILVELELDKGLVEMRGGIALELAVNLPEPGSVVAVPANALVERYATYWLIRANGEEVKVMKTGRTPDGLMKVASDKIKPGDSFRCH